MTPQAQGAPEEIQLRFCQSCGISIPQIDIETGRARAAPGGYICPGCVYQQRDHELVGERIVSASPPRAETTTRVLAVLALLYVVGATTFLLVREATRKPPVLDLGSVARSEDVEQLARKLNEVDDQSKRALTELRANDERHREDLNRVYEGVTVLRTNTKALKEVFEVELRSVQDAVRDVADRTGLLGARVKDITDKVDGMPERGGADSGRSGSPPVVKDEPAPPKEEPPAKSKEELEREKLMAEHIAKLTDPKASDQVRYNAAVQLGDLQHPDAVNALVEALEKDKNDLVRRASAWSLGMLGKHAVKAVPVLIAQLGGKQEYVGYMCERALGEITKAVLGEAQTFNFDPTMSQSARRKVQKKWEEWWEENRSRFGVDAP